MNCAVNPFKQNQAGAYQDLGHGASAAMLSGGRLHLQQGPINLVIKAWGDQSAIEQAYHQSVQQFSHLLPGLVTSLDFLRSDISSLDLDSLLGTNSGLSAAAKAMLQAVYPFRQTFVTPMASVAGAVADQVIKSFQQQAGIEKAYVNNGGDIALYLAEGQSLDVGVVPVLKMAVVDAKISICNRQGIAGIASSGWDGHSCSLGIADAVTVLAKNAAAADVAATMIANQVNVEHSSIVRRPANQLDAQQDLGQRMVTTAVGALPFVLREQALDQGRDYAEQLQQRGLIHSALISLQGNWRIVGLPRHQMIEKA